MDTRAKRKTDKNLPVLDAYNTGNFVNRKATNVHELLRSLTYRIFYTTHVIK
jgi:hypothetical protein